MIAELDLNALQVVTMDFRGHGDSEKVVKPYATRIGSRTTSGLLPTPPAQ